jgi:hypothetical protein
MGSEGRTFALSLHADYACRDSGACCTSGWPIAIERAARETVEAALLSGRLVPSAPPWRRVPETEAPVLAADACGRCVFHEERRCAIHRVLGPAALPSSCRHFPRVCLLSPRGVAVTLSHYCPTAAGLLFRDTPTLRVVADPPAFPPAPWYEGLDARGGPPPLLRPRVWMDWPDHAAWEAHLVATFARDVSAEEALALVQADAEDLRGWAPGGEPLASRVARIASGRRTVPEASIAIERDLALRTEVVDAVPAGLPRGFLPTDPAEADARWVRGPWPTFAAVVRRYLAARAFASWAAVQGEGVRTTVRALAAARAVLRTECGRVCAAAARPLDAELLKDAVRGADLLLVHLASPEALARRWSRVEAAPAVPG